MKRKIRAIWKLLRCKNYMLITDNHNGSIKYDFTYSHFEAKRKGLFIYNFLTESDNIVNEFNEIVNHSKQKP